MLDPNWVNFSWFGTSIYNDQGWLQFYFNEHFNEIGNWAFRNLRITLIKNFHIWIINDNFTFEIYYAFYTALKCKSKIVLFYPQIFKSSNMKQNQILNSDINCDNMGFVNKNSFHTSILIFNRSLINLIIYTKSLNFWSFHLSLISQQNFSNKYNWIPS